MLGCWHARGIVLLLLPLAAFACKCQLTMSACNEAATTDVIFIGTVEAIEPSFLDSWNPSQRAALRLLNQEYCARAERSSPASFTKLRDAYLKAFPDLPEEHRSASPPQLPPTSLPISSIGFSITESASAFA